MCSLLGSEKRVWWRWSKCCFLFFGFPLFFSPVFGLTLFLFLSGSCVTLSLWPFSFSLTFPGSSYSA